MRLRPATVAPTLLLAATVALGLTPVGASPGQAQVSGPGQELGPQEAGAPLRGALLTVAEALSAMEGLPADNPAPESWDGAGGRKAWFGEPWQDVDANGCDTRNDVLGRDVDQADYSRDEGVQARAQGQGAGAWACPDATVWTGQLTDPYTGEVIDYKRGKDTSPEVQIDHVVPLNYLYAHGAWDWDARTRLEVANDPLNLVAVGGQVNHDKGNCGPATCPSGRTSAGTWRTESGKGWWPPQDSYRCQYAARFVSVATAYQLGLPQADRHALKVVLADCAEGGSGTTASTTARTATRAAGQLLADPWLAALAAAGVALVVGGWWLRRRRSRWWA